MVNDHQKEQSSTPGAGITFKRVNEWSSVVKNTVNERERPLFEIPKMLTQKDVYYLNSSKNRRAQSEVENLAKNIDSLGTPGTDTPANMMGSIKSTASIATI